MLLTDLVAQLGYGGLIHNIKNYQLRSNADSAEASQLNIDQINLILQQYATTSLTIREKKALDNLSHITYFYQETLKNLQSPIKQDEDKLFLILQKQVKKTKKALAVLDQNIEIELKNKVFAVGESIHTIQDRINSLVKIIIIISLITLFFFAHIMFKKVISPLQNVTLAMVQLARKGNIKELDFTSHQIFEIKQMIRSIRIFRKNENKRQHTARSLAQMNQTTLQQLEEITKLQNRSEQKTEQALSLASNLIELQKSADIDRNNALDSQRRVNMILNTVHDAIITSNSKGIIESINTSTELMLGYHQSELLGKNITLLMSEDMTLMHQKIIKELNSGIPHHVPQNSQEQTIKRANGSILPVEVFMGQSEFNGEVTYTVVIRDITQRKKDEEAIQQLVLTDPLTNIANRRHFNQELQRSIENAKRLNLNVGLLMIDLDNFKPVNDTYGHNVGDKVLQLVSKRLQDVTRNVDLIARLGGDEFAIILNAVNEKFDPITPAQKVIDTISEPMEIDTEVIQIGATIGISMLPIDALELEDFMNHADKALYKAKGLGKGQYFFYDDLDEDEK